jgi:hypothetical protein
MSKLIFACCLLSSASFLDVTSVVNRFGPSAYSTLRAVRDALSINTIMPALSFRQRR